MKKTNIMIVLILASLLAATGASAQSDCNLQGIYCGTLEGTYIAQDSAGNKITGLGLTADFRADFESGKIRIISVDTSGSTPAILDDTLKVEAVLNKNNKIVVTASGKCGMDNRFSGEMIVDPCDDFKVISNSGEVTVKQSNGGKTDYKLIGVFEIEAEKCCDLPEGTYCGTLEGTYTGTLDKTTFGPFKLVAEFKADFDNKKIKILSVDTAGSYPEIDEENLKVKATLNKDKTITVIANGYCMDGNKFHGEMVIDPCNEFELISSTGWVKVVINEQGQQTKIDIEGDFEVTELEECCKLPDGIYCGTIEGTYTATAPDGTTIPGLGLKADFKVDFDSGKIEILSVETTEGSMIDDDSLKVTATLNEKKKIIRVVAKGKCMENNKFKGVMKIDPCNDFEVISNTGWVIVKNADGNKIKYTVTGDFDIDIWNCDQPCELPEGTYCGTLEGAYIATTSAGELGPFKLKADVKADFESGEIEILNVNTEGSYPEITEINVEATLDKETGIITVTADGTCMLGNVFHGEMEIDACDEFKITDNSGWVKVISLGEMELDLTGDFNLYVWECCELPEEGTYCGTIEGTYQSDEPSLQGTFDLKADFKADYNSGDITISNIDTTGSFPTIDDGSLNVVASLDEEIGVITVTATGTCMGGNDFYGVMRIKACDLTIVGTPSGYVVLGETTYDLTGTFTLTEKECTCELPTGEYCGSIDGTYPTPLGNIGLNADIYVDFDDGTVEVSNIKTTGKDMEIIINEPVTAQLSKDTGMLTVSTTGTIGYSVMKAPFSTEMLVQTCSEEFTFMKNTATIKTLAGDITVHGTDFTINLEPCGITPP